MNNTIKISVVMPVYNVEAYLAEAVHSVLNQTFSNFELILVDDGSTDNSGKLCDVLAEQDNRVLVCHKLNEGVSIARNTGLKMAHGDYISFIDSDDTIHPLMLDTLYNLAQEKGADICTSIGYLDDIDKFTNRNVISIYNQKQALNELFLFSSKMPTSMCLGLFKAKLVNEYGFQKSIHHWEDWICFTLTASHANVIVTTTQCFYYYRQRDGSANHSGINDKVLSCLHIADILIANKTYRNVDDVINVKSFFISQCFVSYICSNNDIRTLYKKKMRRLVFQGKKVICHSKVLSFKVKIALWGFILWPAFTRSLCIKILNKNISNYSDPHLARPKICWNNMFYFCEQKIRRKK